jgi:hypothetical protein
MVEISKDDIRKVVDMYWHDEESHYLANPRQDHIFLVLKRLRKAIGD